MATEAAKLPIAPEVGQLVYELRETGPKNDRTYLAIAFKVMKVMATRFTTDDGRMWKLERDYRNQPYARHNYENTASYWDQWGASKGYRATPSVYSAPGDHKVTTLAEIRAEQEAKHAASTAAADARRKALITENGVQGALRQTLKETAGSFMSYSELRAIKALLTEDQMGDYVEALESLVTEAYGRIHDGNERLASAVERIQDIAKEMSRQ